MGRGESANSVLATVFDRLLLRLREECVCVYGDNLTSLVIFGSVGRGTPNHNSDIDILLIAKSLPSGRMPRVHQFDEVEDRMVIDLEKAQEAGVYTRLSPLFRTECEMGLGGPIFLDMTEDSLILLDKDDLFRKFVDEFSARLLAMNSVRVWRGNTWHWVIKPDLKPGEVFEL